MADPFAPPNMSFFDERSSQRSGFGSMGPRSGISPSARMMLGQQLLNQQLQLQEQQIRLEDMASARQMRELQFETAKFGLEQAREKAKQEREAMTQLSGVVSYFDEPLRDASLSPAQRKAEVARRGLQLSSARTMSPVVQNAYTASLAAAEAMGQADKSRLTYGSYVAAGGDPQQLANNLTPEQMRGLSEDTPLDPAVFAAGTRGTQAQMAQTKAEIEAREAAARRYQEMDDLVLKAQYHPEEAEEIKDSEGNVKMRTVKKPAALVGVQPETLGTFLELNVQDPQLLQQYQQLPLDKRLGVAQSIALRRNYERTQQSPTSAPNSLRSKWGNQ